MRLFQQLSLFSYKILNKQILLNIFDSIKFVAAETTERHRSMYRSICSLPSWSTYAGTKRLSYFLPNLVNKVLNQSYNLKLSDFKTFLSNNLQSLYEKFVKSSNNFNFNCI